MADKAIQKEAIQTEAILDEDVSQDVSKDVADDKVLTPHEAKMAEIVANSAKVRGERVEIAEQEKISMDESEDDSEDVSETTTKNDEAVRMVKLKTPSGEQEVPEADVLAAGVRTMQKEVTVDSKLEAVKRRESELALEFASLAEQRKQIDAISKQLQDGGKSSAATVQEANEKARKIFNTMMEGDEEEAVKALAEALGNRPSQASQPQVNSDELAETITQKVKNDFSIASAQEKFLAEYEMIAKNDVLYQMASKETVAVQIEHPEYNHYEVMREAGDRVMSQLPQTVEQPQSRTDSVVNAKRNRRSVPNKANGSTNTSIKPPKTRSDVVRDLRAVTGYPSYG